MKYDQLYVTSCRRGVTGGSGFQTLAMSSGIQSAERAQVEGLVGYVLPSGTGTTAGEEQTMDESPTNFGYAILASGRWCLFQSVSASVDHNGRAGNYFGHAIIGELGTLPELPYAYWQSPTFLRNAKEVEKRVEETGDTSLALLELVVPGNPVEAVRGGDTQLVSDLITALCCSRSSGRRVVLEASPENAMKWYAAICEALPAQWAHEVTFCTYARDPLNLKTFLHLTAVRKGQGPFGFTNTDRDYTSYVFDFGRESYSKTPPLVWCHLPSLKLLANDASMPQSEIEARGAVAFANMVAGSAAIPSGDEAMTAASYVMTRCRNGRLPYLRKLWASLDTLADEVSVEDAPGHMGAMIMLAKAEDSSESWASMGQLARWLLQRLLFVDRAGWQEAWESAIGVAGGAKEKLAAILLQQELFSHAADLLTDGKTSAQDAACVCSLLMQALNAIEPRGHLAEMIGDTLKCALPLLERTEGIWANLFVKLAASHQTKLLERLLTHSEANLSWLAAESSASWGSEPCQTFVGLALSSPTLRSKPRFASFLFEVAACELRGETAVRRYEKIVRLLAKHPAELHLAFIQPRMFAMVAALAPERLPEVCREYVLSPPSPDTDLGPVLDLLERSIKVASPPKWLVGKVLTKVWLQRKRWCADGTSFSEIAMLHASEMLGRGASISELRQEHPEFERSLMALPREIWASLVKKWTQPFARGRILPAEYAGVLKLLGGEDATRIADAAGWIASKQLPTLLTRGNLQGLYALLVACLASGWEENAMRALHNSLRAVLGKVSSTTVNNIRNVGRMKRMPEVEAFLDRLPKGSSWFTNLVGKRSHQ